MNKQLYRLVFSKHLGMLVPVSEAAVAQICKASGSRVRGKRRAIAAMLAIASSHSLLAWADQPAGLVPHASRPWIGANVESSTASKMTINQSTAKAILNWQTLNLAKGQTLEFLQQSKEWSALNRIFDANPSLISGNVIAPGHIYFVNQNGIIFGEGAQISVGSLTATTLDNISTDDIITRYNNGIVGKNTSGVSTQAFSYDNATSSQMVRVEAGASINAASGGRVMLLAPQVENNGLIQTPDGQTILAAGKKVYLSELNNFAGLLVEVNGGDTANGLGTVTNIGQIVANHGNVSLVGLAVNQNGRISASTSINANGSIYLKARETTSGITFVDPTDKTVATTNYSKLGTVKTSKNSVTEVSVDTDKRTLLNSTSFKKSLVELEGNKIELDGSIIAQGGNVSVQGLEGIVLGNGALIDVSGVDAVAPMSRNQLEIELFSDQLRDSPILRGGALFGKKIYIDKRKGAGGLISDTILKESEALIGTTVAEKMATAGNVDFKTQALIVKAGANVDVSGGSITYEEGFIKETSLLYNGTFIPVSEAKAGVAYQGTSEGYTDDKYFKKWGKDSLRSWDLLSSSEGRLEKSYFDGANAGEIAISGVQFSGKFEAAPSIESVVLDGNFIANTRIGEFQRDTANNKYAIGGKFTITDLNSNLSFVSGAGQLASAFTFEDLLAEAQQKDETQIDVTMFANGFNRLTVNSFRKIDINAPISTSVKGDINLSGNAGINVNQDIRVPSGTLTLTGAESNVGIRAGQKLGNVVVANNVTLSSAGVFTNDTLGVGEFSLSPIAIDGGNITINNGVVLGEGSIIDASAGAYFNAQGKLFNSQIKDDKTTNIDERATGGKGGDITLGLLSNFDKASQLKSNGFTQSGKLIVSTGKDIQLGGINPNLADTEWIPEAFFKQAGFSSYAFSTVQDNAIESTRPLNRNILVGDEQNSIVNIAPEQKNLILNADAKLFKSGTDISKVATVTELPDYLRNPASISLSAVGGLKVNSNATIQTQAPISVAGSRGDITLNADQQLTILGDLIAPAAKIDLTTKSLGKYETGGTLYVYDNTLSLFVGENALLSATGVYINPPSADGNLREAKVTDAGTIALSALNSVVVLKEGSTIDVSGVSGNVDVLNKEGYITERVFGAAGTINVEARNGFALDGTLKANAEGTGAGGNLNLTLTGAPVLFSPGNQNDNNVLKYPNGPRILTVTQNKGNLANNITEGGTVDDLISNPTVFSPNADNLNNASNRASISAQQISEGGFDQVSLISELDSRSDRIVFESGLNFAVPASLILNSAAMTVAGNGNATISAPNIKFSFTNSSLNPTPILGDASLSFFANNIEVVNAVFTGVKTTSLNALQDIKNSAFDVLPNATIKTAGTLNLTARQIYPVTNTNLFNITVEPGNGSLLNVQTNGASPVLPYSAGGTLTLSADDVVQNGVLRAPLGIINLDAKNSLTLGSASLTSVSAEGQILPYGKTSLGGQNLSYLGTVSQNSTPKAKAVNIGNSDTVKVDMQSGAKVDISGGGQALAYEFIAGVGGSSDLLGTAGVYAVIPSVKQEYQPGDALYSAGSDVQLGQAVYLSGGEGLAEGTYTLLPARYALLPGAFIVQADSTPVSKGASLKQVDGSSLMSGYLTRVDGTSRAAVNSTFKVTNANVLKENLGTKDFKGASAYLLTSGDTFFKALANNQGSTVASLAADAGTINISAKTELNLNATIINDKIAGALGSRVNIAADKIKVVSTEGAAIAGTLQIEAKDLNNLNADSVMLGGTRTSSGITTTSASEITFANDAANAVNVKEILVTARDKITLESGSVVNAVSDNTSFGKTEISTAGTAAGSGNGAFFALSAVNDVNLTRNNVNVSANPLLGTLDIQTGTTLSAKRSMVLDATKETINLGTTKVGDNGTLSLGATSILLGDSGNADGTKISAENLANFGTLSAVTLNAYKNINMYGAIAFGNSNLDLIFNAGGVVHENAGDAVITAKTFTLRNSAGTHQAPTNAGASNLTVNATDIKLAGTATGKDAQISGFNNVNLNASKEFVVSGTGAVQVNAAQTNISSARITADTGADYKLTTTGKLATTGNGTTFTEASSGLGAKLNIQATEATLGGNIELLSGGFTVTSTTGDLIVASGANIATKSFFRSFDENYSQYADAGFISLTSNSKDVKVNAGAILDVSGGKTAGDAGTLSISAKNGIFDVADGTLKGDASKGEDKANFALDVKTLSNFSQVNTALETGKLSESRDIRVRTGDVTITDTATAHNFVLSADGGKIDVVGTINADGNEGGNVELYASGNVTLKSTAKLLARGTEANTTETNLNTGSGGSVTLSSNSTLSTTAVSAETGALIDVSGYKATENNNVGVDGAKGDVTLRGYRGLSGNTNTVNVATTSTAAIKGAGEVNIMGVRLYSNALNTFASNSANIVTDTNSFYANNTGSGSYSATQDGLAVSILPEIEVRSTASNDLTVGATATDINLNSLFATTHAGKGGALTLRASRNLLMNGSLSHSFSTATTTGILQSNAKAFNLNLVAGADYTAANPNAVVNGIGDFTLANNKIIRTGTGDINISAGGNMNMNNVHSVIYTAGQAVPLADDATGFIRPNTVPAQLGTTLANYLTKGGDIDINIQGSITGQNPTLSSQSVNQWLLRQGGSEGVIEARDVSWWVRPDLFRQGIAALGGGDVNVKAGANILNLSVSVPTTAQYDIGTSPNNNNSKVFGGGDVTVTAGGDITSGLYYAGRGKVTLDAGGGILKTANELQFGGTVIALQDASAEVSAVKSVRLEKIFNPTLWAQPSTSQSSTYLTYGDNSSVNISSLTGNVSLGGTTFFSTGAVAVSSPSPLVAGVTASGGNNTSLTLLPSQLNIEAFNGDITTNSIRLTPNAQGDLNLLATGNITATNALLISDAASDLLPTVKNPKNTNGLSSDLSALNNNAHASSPVHKGSKDVAVIVARDGDINLTRGSFRGFVSSKPVYISAGKDIEMDASIQHANAFGDVSVIKAGRDIKMRPAQPQDSISVAGSGELLVSAGRNINLGTSTGILSIANNENSQLSETGANVTVVAGLGKEGVTADDYINALLDGDVTKLPGLDSASLEKYSKTDSVALAKYLKDESTTLKVDKALIQVLMKARSSLADKIRTHEGNSNLSDDAAIAKLSTFDKSTKEIFVYRHFLDVIQASGLEYVDTANTKVGDFAVSKLLSGKAYQGDLLMFQSQINTAKNADIHLLVPGGLVNAGLPVRGADLGHDIGIVTQRTGRIFSFVEGDFIVNESKVLTRLGSDTNASDMMIYSNKGDVDAGRGSKTASSPPERLISVDADGNLSDTTLSPLAGSGIRAQSYDPDGNGSLKEPKKGDVYLFAPRGKINIGEAGIGGDSIFLGAQLVVNPFNNIDAGSVSGVAVDTGSLGGSLANVANVAAAATESATAAASQAAQANTSAPKVASPSVVTVRTIRLEEDEVGDIDKVNVNKKDKKL